MPPALPLNLLGLHITLQISVHTANVKEVLRVYAIEVAAREKDDLKEDPIVVRLRKVSGTFDCPCCVALLSLTFETGRWRQLRRKMMSSN